MDVPCYSGRLAKLQEMGITCCPGNQGSGPDIGEDHLLSGEPGKPVRILERVAVYPGRWSCGIRYVGRIDLRQGGI